MKINQVLLRFVLLGENKQPIKLNKVDLKRDAVGLVTEKQFNVLVFQFNHLTIKYFLKSSSGFIFLKKIDTISNYKNIEDITKYFTDTYIKPYLTQHSYISSVTLHSVNYHWEITIPVTGKIKHSDFQQHYHRIPDLELFERVCTKYRTPDHLVFTVYFQGRNFKLTGCTKDINKVCDFYQHFMEIVQKWST